MTVRPPPDDCADIPTRQFGGERIWRVTKARWAERPWWFASPPLGGGGGGGRFDLPQPRGTCYWATERLAAVAEVLFPDAEEGTLPVTMVMERVVVEGPAPDAPLADFTHPDAAAYGVTNELSTGPGPYEVSQDWARELDDVCDGIHYPSRQHTSGCNCAFFGQGGQGRESPEVVTPLAELQPEIEVGLRLRFLDEPALADLEPWVDPPGSS